jgi:DNA-binding HxlR family transcriptional regulator
MLLRRILQHFRIQNGFAAVLDFFIVVVGVFVGLQAQDWANGRVQRAIMILLDLLGRRWSLRALWELREGPQTFRDLQARCGYISPTVLNRRLQELREAALIEHGEGGYRYTALGRELTEQLVRLDSWSRRWAKEALK